MRDTARAFGNNEFQLCVGRKPLGACGFGLGPKFIFQLSTPVHRDLIAAMMRSLVVSHDEDTRSNPTSRIADHRAAGVGSHHLARPWESAGRRGWGIQTFIKTLLHGPAHMVGTALAVKSILASLCFSTSGRTPGSLPRPFPGSAHPGVVR